MQRVKIWSAAFWQKMSGAKRLDGKHEYADIVKHWTKKRDGSYTIDIFSELDLMVVPLCWGSHWAFAIIDFRPGQQ